MSDATHRERIDARRAELQRELETGERRLAELEAERARVRDTLLRIEGALMALTELAQDGDAPPEPDAE